MKFTLVIYLLFIVSCKSNIYCEHGKIKHVKWIYVDGYHIGDVIDFNFQHRLEKDCSIVINNYKIATLKSSTSKEINILSNDNKVGIYRAQ